MEKKKNTNSIYNLIIMLALFIVGLGVFSLYLLLKNERYLLTYVDASFLTFAVLFGIGSLILVVNLGVFDWVAYGASSIYASLRNKPKKYKDLYEYTEVKKDSRKKNKFVFIEFYLPSFVFLVAAIVLRVVYSILYL